MPLFDRVTNNDKMLLVSNMAVSIRAGLTPLESIDINIDQTSSQVFKDVLTSIKNDVEGGLTLSEGFAKFPKYFSKVFISIISAGEQSGNLEKNLEYLGTQLQREYDLQKKIQGALLYPVIILISTVLIAVALSTFVLPRLVSLFKSFGENLPFITQVVLFFAEALRLYWPGIFIGAFLILIIYRRLILVEKFKYFSDRLILNMPLVGNMFRYMHVSRISRSFGSLLSSGLSINECINIVYNSQNNLIYKDVVARMAESINQGGKLYDALENEKFMPILAAKMIGVGERTGSLESTFLYIAEYYEKDLYRMADSLTTTIEPILLILVGGGVGVLAIAIIAPIYQLSGSLNRFR